jgi:Flp pilus assembly protein TadG
MSDKNEVLIEVAAPGSPRAKARRTSMKCQWLNNQHGSVLLFTTVTLVLLFVFGGVAIDLTYFGSVRRELQRTMDAAALAGAGNLGFDDTAFPAARAAAQNYASLNGYSDPAAGAVSLNPNPANDPNGQIVLGIWDGANFVSSLDGTRVNAVRCQFATTVPTSFLRLLGMAGLPVSAQAIAIANPPLTAEEGTCVFPIALSSCPFVNAGAFSSQGCGAAATFISSSGKDPDEKAGTNTAAWANLCGTSTPSAPTTGNAIEGAASGTCNASCATPEAGAMVGTNNGMQQSVFDLLEEKFKEKFNTSGTHQVTDTNGNTTYSGPGWKVFVPVIETDCPPKAINGAHKIAGWTEMVITQVINHGECVVSNPADTNSWPVCPPPLNPSGEAKVPNRRAVFGRYKCTFVDSVASRTPGPRSALGTKLRLVQ